MPPISAESALIEVGHTRIATHVPDATLTFLSERLFRRGEAGERCLLDDALVAEVAIGLRRELVSMGVLAAGSVAIQATAFDKTATTNWKVAWHQDLMFPFAPPVTSFGYALACVKDGVNYARPPRESLERMLAVRLHLDDCDLTNGPLRVVPGSHCAGIIPTREVSGRVAALGETVCLAARGEAVIMRPLLLHASSPASHPRRRRVLHLVFSETSGSAEPWHRAVA